MNIEEIRNNGTGKTTTIAIWKSTKDKLDENRAPGQCYNGFICQLIDLWEKAGEEKILSRAGSGGGGKGDKRSAVSY